MPFRDHFICLTVHKNYNKITILTRAAQTTKSNKSKNAYVLKILVHDTPKHTMSINTVHIFYNIVVGHS